MLASVTQPGGLYLTFAGNANDPNAGKGPRCVQAHELCLELSPIFELVIDGKPFEHLGWSALLRRESKA